MALLGQFLPYYYASMEAHAWTTRPGLIMSWTPALRDLLGLNFRHPQRFGGTRRSLWEGLVFSWDTLRLIATDQWSSLGPDVSRTESPANSARSRLWWACTAGGALVAIHLAQRAAASHGGGGARGSLRGGATLVSNVLLPVGVGFTFGQLALLQRLWF